LNSSAQNAGRAILLDASSAGKQQEPTNARNVDLLDRKKGGNASEAGKWHTSDG